MDTQITHYLHHLRQAADQCDTTTLWRTIARCIERGISDATNLDHRNRMNMNGHGKPHIRPFEIKTKMNQLDANTCTDEALQSLLEHASCEGKEATRCNKQANRLQQLVHRLRLKGAKFPAKTKHRHLVCDTDAPDIIDPR